MSSGNDKLSISPVMVNNSNQMVSPSLPNGHGGREPAPSRQYSCKACFFTTPSLLQFLKHVEKKHYDCHTSKSDTSSHHAATPDMISERKESSESQENSKPDAHTTEAPVEMLENHYQDTTEEHGQNGDTTVVDTSNTAEDANKMDVTIYKVKQEAVADDERVTDVPFVQISEPTLPTTTTTEIVAESQTLSEEDPLSRLQQITDSLQSIPKDGSVAIKENPAAQQIVNTESLTPFVVTPNRNSHQIISKGGKIDSIANSLQECNACKTNSEPQTHQCNICLSVIPINSSQCQNCAQNFTSPNIQPIRVPVTRAMSDNAATAFPYRQSCLPQFKPSVNPKYPLLTETSEHLKQLYSHDDHFRNLQSLMSSSSVTMPHTPILQSIHCDKDVWRDVQETLHQAFSSFPYLSAQETWMLANMTGLSVQQVKTLFVVARLQHGISWDQEEIINSRKFLGIPRNRFEACYTR